MNEPWKVYKPGTSKRIYPKIPFTKRVRINHDIFCTMMIAYLREEDSKFDLIDILNNAWLTLYKKEFVYEEDTIIYDIVRVRIDSIIYGYKEYNLELPKKYMTLDNKITFQTPVEILNKYNEELNTLMNFGFELTEGE